MTSNMTKMTNQPENETEREELLRVLLKERFGDPTRERHIIRRIQPK